MLAELVLSITYLGKHYCTKRCDVYADTSPGAMHEGLVFVGQTPEGEEVR